MKKLMSLVLAIITCLSLCIPAFATQATDEPNLVCEDLPNGDAVFYIKDGNHKISETYVSRSSGCVTYKNFLTGETDTINCPPRIHPSIAPMASYTNAGSINYDYFSNQSDEPQGSRTLKCSYSQSIDISDEYDLNGKYQDLAAAAGILCGYLALPAAVAGEAVAAIASYLGLGTAIGSPIIFPSIEVKCVSTEVTWKLQDKNVSAILEYMSGTRYEFLYDNESCVEYECNYYAPTSFRNKDYDFAYFAYSYVYGPGRCSVTGWN